jgi:hypothetical protein
MSNKTSYCNVADQIEKNNEQIFKTYYDEIFQEINRSEMSIFNTKSGSNFSNELQMLGASSSTSTSISGEQVDDFEMLLDNIISQYEETENPNLFTNKYEDAINFISKYETKK